jgi:hypothetical protein
MKDNDDCAAQKVTLTSGDAKWSPKTTGLIHAQSKMHTLSDQPGIGF